VTQDVWPKCPQHNAVCGASCVTLCKCDASCLNCQSVTSSSAVLYYTPHVGSGSPGPDAP